jgi:hypothetical protein
LWPVCQEKSTKLQFQTSVSHWTPNSSVSFLGTADAYMCKYTVVDVAEQLKHYNLINKQNYCQIGNVPQVQMLTHVQINKKLLSIYH